MTDENDKITKCGGDNYCFSHTVTLCAKKNDYYKHSHTDYELYVFFEGKANFVIEDRVYNMKPGTILLIPPGTYHYVALSEPMGEYDRLVLNFDRIFVFDELRPFLDSANNPFAWDYAKHSVLLADAERSLNTYKHPDKSLLIQLFLNGLLMDMKYMRESANESQALNPTVTQALAYINEHINEPLNLKMISEHVFLNQSYLSQLFTSYMKIGITDYVKQKKIYLAESMIRNERVSPTEASRRLGFSDYSTFYRLYKKYLKESPSDNRKN